MDTKPVFHGSDIEKICSYYNLKKEERVIKSMLKHMIRHEKLKNIYFNVIIVDNPYIHKINKEYRNIDRETDVISFALEDEKRENFTKIRLLGDIYISIDKAKEQAELYGHALKREIHFLTIHGILHLLGYDHIKDSDRVIMRKLEESVLNGYDVKK